MRNKIVYRMRCKLVFWKNVIPVTLMIMLNLQDSVTCVQFNYDGSYVATGDMSGVIQVWKIASKLQVWETHVGDLTVSLLNWNIMSFNTSCHISGTVTFYWPPATLFIFKKCNWSNNWFIWWFIAVVPRVRSEDPKGSATISQGILGYISVMVTLEFTFFFK